MCIWVKYFSGSYSYRWYGTGWWPRSTALWISEHRGTGVNSRISWRDGKTEGGSGTGQHLVIRFILFSLPPSPSQLQTSSTLAVSLSAWLSGSDPLPIDFVLDKRLWINWFPRLCFCGHCINLDFTITLLYVSTNEWQMNYNIIRPLDPDCADSTFWESLCADLEFEEVLCK